jgi:hypothetical protein
MSGNEGVSNTYAQKKYLEWTDDEVLANRKFLRTDAAFRWELAQIEAAGPDWKKQQAEALEIDPEISLGAGGGAGGTGGGDIPDFGPAPDTGDTETPEETPEADTGGEEVPLDPDALINA